MQLTMKEEEMETLLEVLSDALRDLREKVYKTEDCDYRNRLKRREEVIKGLLARLGQTG